MARQIDEIYEAIVAEKDSLTETQGLLPNNDSVEQLEDDLNSGSKVSLWRLFVYLISLAHFTLETLWDFFKAEIEEIVAQAPTGTLPWYQKQMFKFQLGDTLVFQDEKYIYPVIDESKQIVDLCAVEDKIEGVLVVKVAKLDNNLPIPLSPAEKIELEGYISKIRFAGTKYLVVSSLPDLLKLIGTIYYDPIVALSTVQQNVEAAINSYLNNLPFNGVFKITSLIDAVQAVEGVLDMTISTIEAKYGALAYSPVLRIYTAQAGYIDIDPAHDLATNLTYSATTV